MSKILVIPDVHLKPWMFDKADEIPTSKYDSIICLGDQRFVIIDTLDSTWQYAD